jgi:hypothetical protein
MKIMFQVIATAYILTSFAVIGIGAAEMEANRCSEKPTRLRLLFPSYKLGCWLGEEVE